MNRNIALLLATLAPAAAHADSPFSYDYVDVDYHQVSIDNERIVTSTETTITVAGIDAEGDAYGLRGSLSFGDRWFVTGDLRRRTFEHRRFTGFEGEQDTLAIGVGGYWSLGERTDFTARIGSVHVDESSDPAALSHSETAFSALLGVRHALSESTELFARAGTTGLDETTGHGPGDSSTLAEAGARFALTDRWSLLVTGERDGEFTGYGMALRAAL